MNNTNSNILTNWFARPDMGHVVQFYNSGSDLVETLGQYIGTGLQTGDTCIVIATDEHIFSLNNQLGHVIDVEAMQQRGQYITLNATETLSKFMVGSMPDKDLFLKSVGRVIADAAELGKPVRGYGEMVAELWKKGNEAGVLELENLWNRLAQTYEFSLYCAYPDMHFIMDADVKANIHACHSTNLSMA